MAVDYGAGTSSAIASQYADLRSAIASKGEAENRQKARDIERKGLFGSGIKQSDIESFGKLAVTGAKLGHGRMDQKMTLAKDSFQRRMGEGKDRIEELRRFGDDDSINEIRAIQAGMSEERNKFENLMSDYEGSGIWGSRFGTKEVGYKGTGEMSSFAKKMMKKKDRSDIDRFGDRLDPFAQDEASYDYEEKPYTGEFGLPPTDEVKRSDSQPEIPGGPIPTHGLRRKRRRDLSGIGKDEAPIGPGRRSPAQSPSYGSEFLEKLGPDRPRGPLRRSAQGGMQSQKELEDKYGAGAYRVKGLMNRDPYKHTFGDQYSSVDDIDFWGKG